MRMDARRCTEHALCDLEAMEPHEAIVSILPFNRNNRERNTTQTPPAAEVA